MLKITVEGNSTEVLPVLDRLNGYTVQATLVGDKKNAPVVNEAVDVFTAEIAPRKKKGMSKAARARIAEAQRLRWAKVKQLKLNKKAA